MATPKPKLRCSVGRKHGTECGLSARYPSQKEIISLKSCDRETSNHLRSLKVAHSSGILEHDLILLRIGIFDIEKANEATICPKHRDIIGLSWKPSLFCTHPLHHQATNKGGKGGRGVTREISQEIKKVWGVLVPIGAGNNLTGNKTFIRKASHLKLIRLIFITIILLFHYE